MQELHRILVNINNDKNGLKSYEGNRNEQIYHIRKFAEDLSERFSRGAYDWRDESAAKVMLSKDGHARFKVELQAALTKQQREIDFHAQTLCTNCSSDLMDLINPEHEVYAMHLAALGELVAGMYTAEAYFFNTETESARITQQMIDEVMETPDDWAIVLIDCHT